MQRYASGRYPAGTVLDTGLKEDGGGNYSPAALRALVNASLPTPFAQHAAL